MKRRFTILTAALALLTFLTVPMGMWGQTRETVTDNMTASSLAATGTTYTNFSNVSLTSTAVYAGQSAKDESGNIQLRSKNSNSGIVSTTSGGSITSIVINVGSGSNTIDVYGSNTAYTSASDLYGNNQGTKLGSLTATGTITVEGNYAYVGVRSNNGAVYISSINFVWTPGPSYTITALSNNDTYGTVSLSGSTITASPATGYRVSTTNPCTVSPEGSATVSQNGNQFNVTPSANTTVTINFEAIPTYNITFIAGSGTCNTPTMSGLEGSAITLPAATPSATCVSRGWEFAGWATASVSETTTTPTLLSGNYTINGNATLYAVYKLTEGDGGETVFNFADIASQNGWTNGTAYTTVSIDPITLQANGGGNNGKYYTSDNSWRLYNGGSVTITSTSSAVTSVESTPSKTFSLNNNGSASCSFSETTQFTEITVTYGTFTNTYNSNPSCLPIVATPTFTPAAGTYTGAQNVAIECDTDGATILYKTTEEGEWQNYSEAIHVSTTTTIWAKATKQGMDESEVASATYTIQYTLTVNIDDVVEYLLYDYTNETWDKITIDNEGHALVSSGADVRISGGEVYDDCYEVQSFDVTDGNDDPVTVVDNTDDDGTYSFTMPASDAMLTATLNEIADHHTLTVDGLGHVSIEMLVGSMSSVISLNASHQASICEESEVTISELTIGNGFALQSVQLDGVELTETNGVYTFEMPSSDATLTFTTVSNNAPYYALHTGTLVEGDYLIVYNNGAMKNTLSSNRLQYETVTVSSNTIISDDAAIVWHIAQSGNYWTIYSAVISKYAAGTNTKNQATLLDNANSNMALWTVEEKNNNTYEFVNYGRSQASSDSGNKYLRRNGNNGFACYSTSTGGALSLYKLVTPSDYSVEIEPNKWHFIASPTGTAPTNVDALTDLYYYDEQDHFWRNKKVFANANSFVNFDLGKGYLCANAGESVTEPLTLTFTGAVITADSYSIDLDYNATTTEGETNTLVGWNLVGNPFNCKATITDGNGGEKSFYVVSDMNVVPNTGSKQINPCAGVMVQAAGAGESVVFTKVSENAPASQINQLEMTVAQQVMSRGTATSLVHDNAIVNFNAGSQLEKFPFNADAAELYIPQNGKDYAIVSSEAQGEMPVNFKAKENGTYTLSINVEGMEMNYLHLIDNKTGNDVDLLQTPSYSFEAKTTDYESRFKLVFVANNEESVSAGSETFAFFSNGSFVINNEGNAELQVIDITGRIVKSESINGCANVNVNAAPGVYMLRLVNGDNVKTQKVVVK